MEYCARCLYPVNAKPTIIFDDDGVCSGCRYHESRASKLAAIDWDDRAQKFADICDEARKLARLNGSPYDCIVPVSGGKDSHYQVWLLKKKFNMRPLLVTFNHLFNTPAGNRNLYNLVEKSGCDHVRVSAGLDSVKKISRYMLKTVGDLTWHYHAGIRTVPFQVAVEKKIPLIVWGEHGFAELTGIVSLEDFVEFTKWTRKEHDMRGFEAHDLIGHENIELSDIAPYIYPSDEDIGRIGVRGIYMSNFFKWDAKYQAEKMISEWGFSPITYERERTFNLYAKIEDHANDVHDYLKYLKFGYGRATDDASMEIRHGRMTRQEGKDQVKRYDAKEPSSLNFYLDFMGYAKSEFFDLVEPMRDLSIWSRCDSGEWHTKDASYLHDESESNLSARVPQTDDATFGQKNRNLYFNPSLPPENLSSLYFGAPSVAPQIL